MATPKTAKYGPVASQGAHGIDSRPNRSSVRPNPAPDVWATSLFGGRGLFPERTCYAVESQQQRRTLVLPPTLTADQAGHRVTRRPDTRPPRCAFCAKRQPPWHPLARDALPQAQLHFRTVCCLVTHPFDTPRGSRPQCSLSRHEGASRSCRAWPPRGRARGPRGPPCLRPGMPGRGRGAGAAEAHLVEGLELAEHAMEVGDAIDLHAHARVMETARPSRGWVRPRGRYKGMNPRNHNLRVNAAQGPPTAKAPPSTSAATLDVSFRKASHYPNSVDSGPMA